MSNNWPEENAILKNPYGKFHSNISDTDINILITCLDTFQLIFNSC